jgi:predicted kinase
MHGASGSGKSWLSGQLVPGLPAVRIRSDLERKRLAGIQSKELFAKASQQIYTLEFNERTYAHLLECARGCLRGGLNVIVDAAFLKIHERLTFASMAREEDARFSIVSCEADPQTLRSRIAQRNAARDDPSDADENVMLRQLQTMDPFAPEEAAYLLRVDTRAADAISQTLLHVRQQRPQS